MIEYAYDNLSRLTEARYNPGTNLDAPDGDLLRRYQYAFDLAGNRTQQIVSIAGTPTTTNYSSYNGANQIGEIAISGDPNSPYTPVYDANGNLTSDGTNSYVWDRANRLLSMGGASYAYDGEGHRIQQTVGANVTKYLLDLQPGLWVVLAETLGANTKRFVHGPMGIHAQEDASGIWTWAVQDALGNVRLEASNAVAVNGMRNFAPYGVVFGQQGSFGMPYGFTGEPGDGNGLNYHRARYLNPALGVFTALDPLETLNRYVYVDGNPINRGDPSGLQTEVGAACAALVLADLALPVGDAACLVLLAIAGVAGVIGSINASRAVGQLGSVSVYTGSTGSRSVSSYSYTPPPDMQSQLIALTEYVANMDDARREIVRICNEGICGTTSLRQLIAAGAISYNPSSGVAFARDLKDAPWIQQEYDADDVNYGDDHWRERKGRCWDDVLPNGSEEDIAAGRYNQPIEDIARRIINRPDKTMLDNSSGNHHWVGQENGIWIHIVVHVIYRGEEVVEAIRDIVQALFCQDPDCNDPHPCV